MVFVQGQPGKESLLFMMEAYIIVVLLIVKLAAAGKHSLLTRRAGGVGFFVVWTKSMMLARAFDLKWSPRL